MGSRGRVRCINGLEVLKAAGSQVHQEVGPALLLPSPHLLGQNVPNRAMALKMGGQPWAGEARPKSGLKTMG